jgi:hypothetical protein
MTLADAIRRRGILDRNKHHPLRSSGLASIAANWR